MIDDRMDTHEAVDRDGHALRQSEQRLLLALEAFRGYLFDIDVARNHVLRVGGFHELTGYRIDEAEPTPQWWRERIHPDDAQAVVAAEAAQLASAAAQYELQYRIVRRNGEVRWVLDRTRVVRSEDGAPSRMVGTVVDVTELQHAHEARGVSEARLEAATNAADVGIFEWNIASDLIDWDPRIRQIWGVGLHEQLTYATFIAGVLAEDRGLTDEKVRVALNPGGDGRFHAEYRVRRRTDGAIRWVAATGRAYFQDGLAIRLIGTAVDITDRYDAEHALRLSEERLRLAIENAGIGTWDADVQSGASVWSGSHFRFLGYQPTADGRATLEMWRSRIHPEDALDVEARIREALSGPGHYSSQHRIVRANDGAVRRMAEFGRVLPARSAAEPRHFVGVSTDVTEITNATEALEKSETRFRVLANSVPQLVWTNLPDGTTDFMNEGWFRYTGVPTNFFDDPQRRIEVVHPDDNERVRTKWHECLKTGGAYQAELRLRRHDGAYRWFLVRAEPQRNAAGQIERWYGTCTDVEDAKQAQGRLEEQDKALREADRRKDEFLATLAHELRNPLSPIRHAAAILKTPTADEDARSWAAAIVDRQAETMSLLLDDLLDVSRITRGQLRLNRQRVLLTSVVDTAVEVAMPLVQARRHALTVAVPPGRVELDVDPVRAAQVITNLLTNAAKYTNTGGHITLTACAGDGFACVAVKDDGVGLNPESLSSIFGMFSQVDTALERAEGGLGIGLALAKGLVELHGGTIEARSDGLGQGSEFRVCLPLASADPVLDRLAHSIEALVPSKAGARRILVADDNVDAAQSLKLLLEMAGHEVHLAHDGRQAIYLAEQYVPELAIIDIGMPKLNGYDVARSIRSTVWGRSVYLVALTGWGQEDDKRRAASAGFDLHLTKPVDPDRIFEILVGVALRVETARQ